MLHPAPITILDVARARGVRPGKDGAISGAEFLRVDLPLMGECQVCEATISAYNAFPSRTGYLRCRDCIEDLGFASVEEFEASAAAPPAE